MGPFIDHKNVRYIIQKRGREDMSNILTFWLSFPSIESNFTILYSASQANPLMTQCRSTLFYVWNTGSFFTPVKNNILCILLNFHQILQWRVSFLGAKAPLEIAGVSKWVSESVSQSQTSLRITIKLYRMYQGIRDKG